MLSTAHVSLDDVIEVEIIEGNRIAADLTYPAVSFPHTLTEVFPLRLARQTSQSGVSESPVSVTCHAIIVPILTHVSDDSAVPVMADDTGNTLMQVDRSLAKKAGGFLARTPAAPEGETVRADG